MCKECHDVGDAGYIEDVLPRYLELLRRDPKKIISANEANAVIARALHHPSEDELMWIGGEQTVRDFVSTLESFRVGHH